MGPGFGIIRVSRDGAIVASVNLYASAATNRATVWSASLPPGFHVLRFEYAGTRDPRSSSGTVNVDALVVS